MQRRVTMSAERVMTTSAEKGDHECREAMSVEKGDHECREG